MPTITLAQYLDETRDAIRVTLDDGRELTVPVHLANRHYQELLEYIDQHPELTITDPDPQPPAPPIHVSKVNLVRAMRKTRLNGAPLTDPGTQTSVWQASRAALPGAPADLKEDWDMIADIPRDDPVIEYVVATLPWAGQAGGPAIMDHLFDLAIP